MTVQEAPVSMIERLLELAREDPDRIAVVADDRSISRGELEAESDRWARELIHLGVRFLCEFFIHVFKRINLLRFHCSHFPFRYALP